MHVHRAAFATLILIADLAAVQASESGSGQLPIRMDFETQEQIDAFAATVKDSYSVKADTTLVHGGHQALTMQPSALGDLRVPIPLPKNFSKGVISFWFYDRIFAAALTGAASRAGWDFGGTWMKPDGKSSWGSIGFDNSRGRSAWTYDMANDLRTDSSAKRHAGWTKFDIIVEPDGPARSVIVAIDGIEIQRIPATGFKPASFTFCNYWGADDITIDDLVISDDPATYKPAVVQSVVTKDFTLSAGQPLTLDLALAPTGASAASGTLTVELLDLQEKSVAKVEKKIAWKTITGAKLAVDLPSPPGSRHYWVVSSYRDDGATSDASRTIDRIDVQYIADAKAPAFRGRLGFTTPWDWMPADRAAITTVPAAWDGATRIRDFWFNGWDRRFKDVTIGWYRREVDIPTAWAGRRILLSIEQPGTSAKAFINGVAIGEAVWPGGELDITDQVKPGTRAALVLLVDALAPSALGKSAIAALSTGAKLPEWYRNEAYGLGGAVALLAEPQGARIDAVTITPNVASMVLTLDVQTLDLAAGASYTVEGTAAKAGKAVKSFTSAPFKAGSGATTIAIPWPEAALWDIGRPNLYDLEVRLVSAGKAIDARLPERFGFRDIAFDGRIVKLNGNPINFTTPMPTTLMSDFGFAQCMVRNNQNYITNNHHSYYAKAGDPNSIGAEDHFDLADEAGFGVDFGVSDVPLRKFLVTAAVAGGTDFRNDPTYWPAMEQVVQRGLKRYGNRPSVLFLLGPGNGGQLEMGNMINPAKQDGLWLKQFADKPVMRQFLTVEQQAKDILHRLAPHHLLIGQDAGNFNDAIHITHYAGFMPIQEFIESDSYWVKNGTKPYFITEQSAPFLTDWTTGARKGHNSPDRYGTVAERAAPTKGDAAFHRSDVDLLELTQFEQRCAAIRKNDPTKRFQTSQPPLGPLYAYARKPELPSVFHDIIYERAREQWLNWRADGLGLHTYWEAPDSGSQRAMREAWDPVTGFLAGTPTERTDKTHLLRPGETWTRRFLAMSNRREPVTVDCAWTATLAGKPFGSGTAKATIAPGGQASFPITLIMPSASADASGTLAVELSENGTRVATDTMDFQVLATTAPPKFAGRVALIDPEGASADLLDACGIRYQRLQFNADLSGYGVVVFGRSAFSHELAILGRQLDLGGLLADGKRVLILEQDEATLRDRFRFRTEYASPRSAFGRIADHPVTRGLPDAALSFWRGSATLTDGYSDALTQKSEPEMNGARRFVTWNDGKEHPRQMKWGNHHNVATVVIEKPTGGRYRSLIDCEYALNYAAVLELEDGPGRMLFCQADVSGRTATEPAAERLLVNMIAYLDGAKPTPAASPIAYLGGDHGADLLDKIQASYRRIALPDEVKAGETLVLGEGLAGEKLTAWKATIARFVDVGGSCLSLPRAADELGFLPTGVTVKDAQVDSTIIDKPARQMLAGMSNADLYYSGRIQVLALDQLPKDAFTVPTGLIAELPSGKGRYVLCQVSPDSFDCDQRFYLEDSKRTTYRVYQTLLNNLGAASRTPAFLERPAAADTGTKVSAPLDLAATGAWKGLKTTATDAATPTTTDARWHPVKVPGYVGDQSPEWNDNKSFTFWYRCGFTVDQLPQATATATLFIGAIDDEDDVFLNGTRIGHTGRDTNMNDWLQAPRYYKVPAGLLKAGANELTVKVFTYQDKCGISTGPVRLSWDAPAAAAGNTSLMELAKLPPVDLSGWWYKLGLDAISNDEAIPPDSDPRWSRHNKDKRFYLPSTTSEIENTTTWFYMNLQIPEIPAGARPTLSIAAIDDEDTIFVNGQKIGHIGKDTNPKNYWEAPRIYAIPAVLLKTGPNRITIKANNLPPGPGAIKGPMQLFWMPPEEAAKLRLAAMPYAFEVGRYEDPYWWMGGW